VDRRSDAAPPSWAPRSNDPGAASAHALGMKLNPLALGFALAAITLDVIAPRPKLVRADD
jgi:hypothetical protein